MTMSTLNTEVIVVGAGLAGLACAQRLWREGIDCVVLEKSRGIGGRVATRQLNGFHFDYGCPTLDAEAQAFSRLILKNINNGNLAQRLSENERNVAAWSPHGKGLRSVFEEWRARADILIETKVTQVVRESGRVVLHCEGQRSFSAPVAVFALPIPQAVELLGAMDVKATYQVDYTSEVVLSASVSPAADAGFWPGDGGVLSSVMMQKNERTGVLVFRGTEAFSKANWAQTEAFFAGAFLDALRPLDGTFKAVSFGELHLHRWRYSRVVNPLPDLFGRLEESPSVYLAGDAFGQGTAEAAWNSGEAVAADVLSSKYLKRGLNL